MNINEGYWLVVSQGMDRCFIEVAAGDDATAIARGQYAMANHFATVRGTSGILYNNGVAIKKLDPHTEVIVNGI